MSKEFVLPPFPELEYDLLKKITQQFHNWQYLEIEAEDLVQETLIVLLQKMEEWNKVREASNSTTLIYYSLRNYAAGVYRDRIREIIPFSHQELADFIEEQIKAKSGYCYEYYYSLNENSKVYFQKVYVEKENKTKNLIAEESGITVSKMNSIELKIKQTARIEMKKKIFSSLDLGDLNV